MPLSLCRSSPLITSVRLAFALHYRNMLLYLPSRRSAIPAFHHATRGSIMAVALPFGHGITTLVLHDLILRWGYHGIYPL